MRTSRPLPTTLIRSDKLDGTQVSSQALKLEQNGKVFYSLMLRTEDIFPFCYVVDRQEDPLEGFQRELQPTRPLKIAHYLDVEKGAIPTNIVLSAQESAEVKFDPQKQILQFKRCPRSFLVLDGQHRLYGYAKASKSYLIPVTICRGLTKEQEVSLFVDINTTQIGVSAALILDIKHMTGREKDAEKDLRELFDFLATSKSSPLNGLMSPSKAVKGRLARPVFNRAVLPVLKTAVMQQLDKEKRFKLFENFLRVLEEVLQDPKGLLQNVYLEAFCSVFEEVMKASRDNYNDYKIDSLRKVLKPLKALNLSGISTGGRARLTKATLVPLIKGSLFGELYVDGSMV
jgi:DGQHR domain-containing protein